MTHYGYRKLAACSPRGVLCNPAANAAACIAAMEQAAREGAQIIVFPELFLSGVSCGDLIAQPQLLNACEGALNDILERSKTLDALCFVGMPLLWQGRLYNCAAAFQRGRLCGVIPKMLLCAAERRWFSAPAQNETISLLEQELPFGRLLFCCEDTLFAAEIGSEAWQPLSPAVYAAGQGAQLILNLAGEPDTMDSAEKRKTRLCALSERLQCAYLYCGSAGWESGTDHVYAGSCLFAENGELLAETQGVNSDAAITACADIQRITALRLQSGFHTQQAGAAYTKVSLTLPPLPAAQINRRENKTPFVPPDSASLIHALDLQSAALARRLAQTGMQKLIVGVSGGLDSTLALLVMQRTRQRLSLPAEHLLCVSMPGFGTSDCTRGNAARLTAALGFALREIPIAEACNQHMRDIGQDMHTHDVTYENIQARERTQILMDLANRENALLVGTGDLSELALGWCTYNGDHMSMYAVNAGVPKTLVRALVAQYAAGADAQTAAVLRDILDTPVSPELLPVESAGEIAQKTEEVLGPYEVHDFYLYHFFTAHATPEKLLFLAEKSFAGQYEPADLKRWLSCFLRRFFSQQFKRSCLPDGPQVTPVSLSPRGAWHMPSDSSPEAWFF